MTRTNPVGRRDGSEGPLYSGIATFALLPRIDQVEGWISP